MRLSVVRVNLINASQAAMCAAGGVLFFDEALTVWLVLGTLLTMGGLMLMERPSPCADRGRTGRGTDSERKWFRCPANRRGDLHRHFGNPCGFAFDQQPGIGTRRSAGLGTARVDSRGTANRRARAGREFLVVGGGGVDVFADPGRRAMRDRSRTLAAGLADDGPGHLRSPRFAHPAGELETQMAQRCDARRQKAVRHLERNSLFAQRPDRGGHRHQCE